MSTQKNNNRAIRRTPLALMAVVVFLFLPSAAFADGFPDVASLFEKQKASVVSVQTEVAPQPGQTMPFFGNPQPGPQRGTGSGFVVDPKGYVITNNHVVEGAQKITVKLENGDQFDAALIGSDANTDIALLKVETPRELPAVTFGDSSNLKVGEWVVAIGNPFGLDYSVTAGIISAKGRNIGAGPYDDFLQTDASINPGNSGGPLFNLDGEVIGVNTAIIRHGQGIGFAVPINMVTSVMGQLKKSGYVVRGYMGAGIQPLDDRLAKSFGLPREHGVLIGSIEDGGPAASAGLRPGDIVTHFDGRRVREVQELLLAVAEARPGARTDVRVLREGQKLRISLLVAERPDARRADVRPASDSSKSTDRLGVQVRKVDARLAARLGQASPSGVIVERVLSGSPASQALRPGDVILQVGSTGVADEREFFEAVSKSDGLVRLLVMRDGRTTFVAIALDS